MNPFEEPCRACEKASITEPPALPNLDAEERRAIAIHTLRWAAQALYDEHGMAGWTGTQWLNEQAAARESRTA